jgi:hypothetical protein
LVALSSVESNLDKLLTKLLSRVVTRQKNLWDQLEKTDRTDEMVRRRGRKKNLTS